MVQLRQSRLGYHTHHQALQRSPLGLALCFQPHSAERLWQLHGIRRGNGSTLSNYNTAYTTNTGTWYYAAYTYDGTTLTAYMNGSPLGTSTAVSGDIKYDGYGQQPWLIGTDYSIAQGYFDGLIDEVHIASVPRSADWLA